jgi:hypothetical protein
MAVRESTEERGTLQIRYDAKYIVSDEHEFIYFIIQKSACTSIKTALLPLFDIDPSAHEVQQEHAAGYGLHGLFTTSSYLIDKGQLVAELNGRYRDYFKFAFVRNPWDRLVSCYSEKVADSERAFKPSERRDIRLGRGTPFAEFVETVCTIPDNEANIHFRSQHKTVCGPGEDRPIMADFVGRFENLAADFDVVAERIGGAHKPQLPHRHRSRSRESRSYVEFYDDGLRNLVRERFWEDIEIFGYSYGDPDILPPIRPNAPAGSSHLERNEAEGLREQNRNLEQAVEMLSERNRDLEGELRSAKKQMQELRKSRKRNRDLERELRSTRKQMQELRKSRRRNRDLEREPRSAKTSLLERAKRFWKRIVHRSGEGDM